MHEEVVGIVRAVQLEPAARFAEPLAGGMRVPVKLTVVLEQADGEPCWATTLVAWRIVDRAGLRDELAAGQRRAAQPLVRLRAVALVEQRPDGSLAERGLTELVESVLCCGEQARLSGERTRRCSARGRWYTRLRWSRLLAHGPALAAQLPLDTTALTW